MISSTVYNLKHKDGLNQRVQQVTFDSLNEIEFLKPAYNPDSFDAVCNLYDQFFIQKYDFICGWILIYTLIDDLFIPDNMFVCDGMSFFDRLSCVNYHFKKNIKLKNNKLVFLNKETEQIFNYLKQNKKLHIVKGKRNKLTCLPVSKNFGYLSQYQNNYQLLVNSNFFVMLHFDCDSFFDSVSTPVGLMVKNGKIIAPNLYDRECLIVRDNKVTIETIRLSQLKIEIDGITYQDNVNCQLYQRGKNRRSKKGGFDIVVVNDRVLAFKKNGNCEIPESGFVIKIEKEISIKEYSVKYHGLEDVSFGLSVGNSTVVNGKVTDKFISPFYNMFSPIKKAFVPAVYPLNFKKDRAPRIVLGADKDNKAMLLWFEGAGKFGYDRNKDSSGASLKEVGEICQRLQMYNGINLDGGGSAQIIFNRQRQLMISDRNKNTFQQQERAVPTALVIK